MVAREVDGCGGGTGSLPIHIGIDISVEYEKDAYCMMWRSRLS